MDTLSRCLQAMLAQIGAECEPELALLQLELPKVPASIPRLDFREALQIAGAMLGADLRNEPDLAPAHERALGEWALREHGSDFVFVVGYPTAQRAFYTAPEPSEPYYSRGFDLLFRGLELVSGAQRLHRYEDYVAVLQERGMALESFAGYLEAFRHGMPPHGGFAIGLERLISRIANLPNIREATLFPRDLQRLKP